MTTTLIQVALGGAIGASGRYLTGLAATRIMGPGFPWGTLTVNVVGSFLMGLLAVVLMAKFDNKLAPFLMTGVLGGFTTFSAFSLDAIKLIEGDQMSTAILYILASVLISLLALVAGLALARGIIA